MQNSTPSSPEDFKVVVHDQPRTAQGWERVFPVFIRRTDTGWQVQILWRRLAVSMVLLTGLLWVGAATAAYLFVKYQRGFEEVRFMDMLFLPTRWESYRAARGDFYINAAQGEFAHRKYHEALNHLQVGVNLSPGNRDGRVLLAKFYTAYHRPDRAEKLLMESLPVLGGDLDYLKAVFTFLIEQQRDTVTIATARDLLGKEPALNERNQLIALAYATACFYRGNYDQAEDLMRKFHLERFRDGQLLTVRIEWERGYHPEAMARLRELKKALPADEEVYAQTITYLREGGRESEARRESLFRQLAFPNNPHPRIDLLYAYKSDGDLAAVQTGATAILHDFPKDQSTLFALADFAANSGDPELARRIYEQCKNNDLNWEVPAMMIVEAHVVAKQYQAAMDMVARLIAENPSWGKTYYAVFNGLQAIASYGLGVTEDGQLYLANFLNQSSLRAENLVAVSNRLAGVGARTQAQVALAKAVKSDPLNQSALTSLVKLDVELSDADDLGVDIRRLLLMRKPDRDAVESAYRKLGSDLFLFHPERTELLQEVRTALDSSKTHS